VTDHPSSGGPRIERIDAFPLEYAEPHYRGARRCVTLVRITAGDGTAGWGEAISQFPEATTATKTLVDGGFAPLLLDGDALDVEGHWGRMCAHAYWYGVEGIAAFAISAIDMALWDLKGKLLGQPVADLLGTPVRREIPAMGSIIFDMDDLDWTLAEFAAMRDAGYEIVKAGWGMRPGAVFGDDADRDLTYLTEVRNVIGDERSLIVDTPGARGIWSVEEAIGRLRAWERFDLRWVEQPLPPGDLPGYARLRASVDVPIGAGEDEWSPETYGHVIGAGAVDVLQLDPGRCLGLTGCKRVIAMCEDAGIRYSAHSWSGALNTAASVAFLAISEAGDTTDFKPHESPMQHELVEDPWEQVGGYLAVRSVPGLGVHVREDAVERFRLS
jgi:L-alanine-DL-glutamate epimerase-like enolase superfamily enzyme